MIVSDPDLRHHLESGRPFFNGFKTEELFRKGWELTRETLLPEFIKKHPGERPFGWWLCDHKKERPVISQTTHDGQIVTREWLLDHWHDRHDKKFGFLHTNIWPPFQEYETDYLERLGILEDWEIARVREMEAEDLKRLETDPHAGIHTRRIYSQRTDYGDDDE
jgi:hypothetical protein